MTFSTITARVVFVYNLSDTSVRPSGTMHIAFNGYTTFAGQMVLLLFLFLNTWVASVGKNQIKKK